MLLRSINNAEIATITLVLQIICVSVIWCILLSFYAPGVKNKLYYIDFDRYFRII